MNMDMLDELCRQLEPMVLAFMAQHGRMLGGLRSVSAGRDECENTATNPAQPRPTPASPARRPLPRHRLVRQ